MSEVEPVRAGSDPETLQTAALVLLEAGLGVLVAAATLTVPTRLVRADGGELHAVAEGGTDQGEHCDGATECLKLHFKSPVNVDDLLASFNLNLNFTALSSVDSGIAKRTFPDPGLLELDHAAPLGFCMLKALEFLGLESFQAVFGADRRGFHGDFLLFG